MQTPNSILIDKRNYEQFKDQIAQEISNAPFIGLDLETQDVGAHDGIKTLRKENADGDKSAKGKSVFDWRKMVITGLSIYPDGSDNAYYFNLAHSDVENRLFWKQVKSLLDLKAEGSNFLCHNAPFELTVLANAVGYTLPDVICTLQMAVSAYGPDEYNKHDYLPHQLGEIKTLFHEAESLFSKETIGDKDEADLEEVKSKKLNSKQNELLLKVIGKQSHSSFSYNGVTHELAYTYGLKEMVKKFFGVKMTSFQETLGDSRHMGELTGQQVVQYGCDDSFWAVKLFYKLLDYMTQKCPEAINTFFTQENPMIYVYSQIRQEGMKVNLSAIESRRDLERKQFAQLVRELKLICRDLLPFEPKPNEALLKDKWYTPASAIKNRLRFEAWAKSPNLEDDFKQACQVSSPVSNAWSGGKCDGLSIGHYMQTRLMLYDLCGLDTIKYKGKIQSDGETRGMLRERVQKLMAQEPDERLNKIDKLLKILGDIAQLETRMKLYLTPYLLLTDPETKRMYPEVSSMLASRRMAASNPNPMQLAKRGESTYVRGFYEPDEEDEVYVSLDWSQVELVLVGELSGDPEFAKAFGQLPYLDLHLGTAAEILSVMIPEVTYDMLKNMHTMGVDELPPKLLVTPNGDTLSPKDAKKFWRTVVGKGSNFNYFYSGALNTVGETLGWTSDQMWAATERYRERFIIAEKWRQDTINFAREHGYCLLPDGHRRVRWEATYEWANITQKLFDAYEMTGVSNFGKEIIRSIKSRAGNQIVNSLIQGSSATLAKRSILRIIKACEEQGIRATFKMPIHDELLFSVHKQDVVKFIRLAKQIMCDHPDIVKNLKLYATASVGLTFQPFDDIKAPIGQIELDEAPAILGFGDGVVLNEEQIQETINWLFERKAKLNG